MVIPYSYKNDFIKSMFGDSHYNRNDRGSHRRLERRVKKKQNNLVSWLENIPRKNVHQGHQIKSLLLPGLILGLFILKNRNLFRFFSKLCCFKGSAASVATLKCKSKLEKLII